MTEPAKILVVEDNEIAREGLSIVLKRQGFHVATAGDGQIALDMLKSGNPPHVILLDMMLPVLDGWHFLQQITSLKLNPAPHIIVTTGNPSIGRDWAIAHRCSGFIHKPIEPESLLAEIERCVKSTP